ncbi:MAG TPA: hypothetical protein P5513_06635 [Candidatus Diapherotrites archaeon]|nr:hypothetical protein [Candidatus Diapherotrites archaeon]
MKKVILENEFQKIILNSNRYYIENKYDQVCVLPYTIDNGLLDKIGVIEIWNEEEKENALTLLTDYLSKDDETNLVGANRILYSIIGINIKDASRWMYLGSLFNSLFSLSPLKIYSVNLTDIKIEENVLDLDKKRNFKFVDSSMVTQTDDILFLGAFNRLFNFFYTNSIK